MEQKLWYIKNTGSLFSGLKEEEHQFLAQISKMVNCERRYQFYLSDEPSDKIYLVKEGKVRLGKVNIDGDEITLDVLGPGEIFGELSLTDEERRSHFAEATEDSMVCIFPREEFQEFLATHHDLTFKVMKLIGFRLREMEARLQDLTFQSVSDRVRTTLLKLAERHGIDEGSGQVRLSITQKDIAFLVGATRESVAEELGQLKRSGLIKTSYRSLVLADVTAL